MQVTGQASPSSSQKLFHIVTQHSAPQRNDSKLTAMNNFLSPASERKTVFQLLTRGILLLLLIMISWHGYLYIQVFKYRSEKPDTTAFMQSALLKLEKKHTGATLKQRWVDYNNISLHLKRAVIAAEDATFTEHHGFDWQGIRLAMEKNISKGRIAAGGSTLSQQLAKNLFLSSEKSLWRKGKEASITVMIESTLSKKRIFELYLNYAEWGKGIFGADAAARHYFGIPASMLTAWQSARLASMLTNPRYYDGRKTRWLDEKSNIILTRMPKVRIPR